MGGARHEANYFNASPWILSHSSLKPTDGEQYRQDKPADSLSKGQLYVGEGIHPGDVYWSLQDRLQLHKGLGLLRGGKVKVTTVQSITIHPIEQV